MCRPRVTPPVILDMQCPRVEAPTTARAGHRVEIDQTCSDLPHVVAIGSTVGVKSEDRGSLVH